MRLATLVWGILLIAAGVCLIRNGQPVQNWSVWVWIKAAFGAVAVASGVERAFIALFASDQDLLS